MDDADWRAALRAEQVAGDYYPYRPQDLNEDAVRLLRAAELLRESAADRVMGDACDIAAFARLLDAVGQVRLRAAHVDDAILDAALNAALEILERGPVP